MASLRASLPSSDRRLHLAGAQISIRSMAPFTTTSVPAPAADAGLVQELGRKGDAALGVGPDAIGVRRRACGGPPGDLAPGLDPVAEVVGELAVAVLGEDREAVVGDGDVAEPVELVAERGRQDDASLVIELALRVADEHGPLPRGWWCAAWVLRRHGPPGRGASPLSVPPPPKSSHFYSEIHSTSLRQDDPCGPQLRPARASRPDRSARPGGPEGGDQRPGSTSRPRATPGQVRWCRPPARLWPRRPRPAARAPSAGARRTGTGRRPGCGVGRGRRPWPRRRTPRPGPGRRSTPSLPHRRARTRPRWTSARRPGSPAPQPRPRPSHRNDRPTSSDQRGSPAGRSTSTHTRVVRGHQHRAPARPAAHHGRSMASSGSACVLPSTTPRLSGTRTSTAGG